MLKVYALEGCPYCEDAIALLNGLKVKYKRVLVTQKNKDKIKKDLNVDTFPQLVLGVVKGVGKGYVKLGGYDDLEKIVAVCQLLTKAGIDSRGIDYICRLGR